MSAIGGTHPQAPARALPLASELLHALARPWPEHALAVVTMPAPIAPLDALWSGHDDAVLWDPPGGAGVAGIGIAAVIDVAGEQRMSELARRGGELLARVCERNVGAVVAPATRLIGGLAFAPGDARGAWAALGDGRFVLPRWSYGHSGRAAWLRFAAPAESLARERVSIERELASLLALLSAPRRARARDGATPLRITRLPRERWGILIDKIRGSIARGELDKVVAARETRIEAEHELDALAVLAALDGAAGCTRIGFRTRGVTFAGATPERLIARRGLDVAAEALAGTISASGDDAGQKAGLLASRKDQGEHAFVVDAIVRVLAPRCETLSEPAAPRIRRLRDMLHLSTSITGRLRAPEHVIALAAALHPTPAVAGVPQKQALDWIRTHEPAARGWYAGPFGWFDACGDGELVVALRSGLIAGREARLYAGAGIVADSDAAAEYDETELKQRTMLAAVAGGGAAA